jgi:hypothetical protein
MRLLRSYRNPLNLKLHPEATLQDEHLDVEQEEGIEAAISVHHLSCYHRMIT